MSKLLLVARLLKFRGWLFGLGLGGFGWALWWIIKLIICLTMGICIC